MKRLMILVMALGTVAVPLAARAQNAGAPAYEKPLSAEAVRDVQARLKGLGYYGGPVDANWGLRRRAQRPVLSAAGAQRSSRRFPRLLHALKAGTRRSGSPPPSV